MPFDKEIELLAMALNSEFGIEVELLGNYQASLQRLHSARRKDPDFASSLQISRSPTSPMHLFIVKVDRPQPEPTGADLKANPAGEGPLFNLVGLFGDD